MLDQMIRSRTRGDVAGRGRHVAHAIQRVSRLLAGPALILMLGGLAVQQLAAGERASGAMSRLPGPAAFRLDETAGLLGRGAEVAMSLGLAVLAAIPLVTVASVTVNYLSDRRWRDAGAAAVVTGILILSVILGSR